MPVTSNPRRTRSVSPLHAASVVLPSKHPLAVHRLEVIEAPDAVETKLVGKARTGSDFTPRHPLLGDVQTEPHAAPPQLNRVLGRSWRSPSTNRSTRSSKNATYPAMRSLSG